MYKEDPKPEEEVCFNCKHLFWGIGLGLGLRCSNALNKKADQKEFLPLVPSRRHTCEYFSNKKNHS